MDRAALDVAAELGIPGGGFVPRDRKAEDGPLDSRYPVTELDSADYDERTRRNVLHAAATLILSVGPLTGGSALTLTTARRHDRPVLHVDLAPVSAGAAAEQIRRWLGEVCPAILNVAGPRESTTPGIYARARELLLDVLRT